MAPTIILPLVITLLVIGVNVWAVRRNSAPREVPAVSELRAGLARGDIDPIEYEVRLRSLTRDRGRPLRRGIAIAILALASIACEPAGEPRIDCQDVPLQHCQIALADARAGSAERLTELVVRCTSPSCTPEEGEVDVEASWAGGNGAWWSFGWSAGEPARPGVYGPQGPLPVQPVCLDVPDEACRQQAMSGMPRGGPQVESITVRCTAICTPAKGEGETVVRLVDGTSTTSEWSYESVGL